MDKVRLLVRFDREKNHFPAEWPNLIVHIDSKSRLCVFVCLSDCFFRVLFHPIMGAGSQKSVRNIGFSESFIEAFI